MCFENVVCVCVCVCVCVQVRSLKKARDVKDQILGLFERTEAHILNSRQHICSDFLVNQHIHNTLATH